MWYKYLLPSHVKCIFCGGECSGIAICGECYDKLPFIENHCATCGGEKYGELDICDDCVGRTHLYDNCHCILNYDGEVRGKILTLKNNKVKYIARPFADILLDEYQKLGWDVDVIIPVPIHPNRERARGYNQSELLCDSLSEEIGIVDTDVLIRVVDTPHQTGLTRANREQNLHSAFKVTDRAKVKGKNILIVDDIYTTGSTIDACVRVLKKAGARSVSALCLTRTPVIKNIASKE